MAASIRLEPEADADLDEAFQFYESQRTGLGSQFLTDVDRRLAEVATAPLVPPVWRGQYRRAKLRQFPHYLYYLYDASADRVVVKTVFHPSRDPAELARRLGLP
jgi:plasmid stabilization system protein ParE